MKAAKIFFALFICLLISISCTKEEPLKKEPQFIANFDNLILESSMKGWELYSWSDGDNWNFSLIEGSNRYKTYEEVTGNNLIVKTPEKLKSLLSQLPPNEFISWVGENWMKTMWPTKYNNLAIPETNVVNEIKKFCTEKNIILWVGN